MDPAFVIRDRVALSCKGAHVIVHAAEKRAAAIGVPQNIAVVDAGGRLVAFSRMDDARSASIEIAMTKARSAAMRLRPTADEGVAGEPLSSLRITLASGNDVTNIPGGLPIVVDGQVIGGVGVSSGTSDQDVDVAQAGLAAVLGDSG